MRNVCDLYPNDASKSLMLSLAKPSSSTIEIAGSLNTIDSSFIAPLAPAPGSAAGMVMKDRSESALLTDVIIVTICRFARGGEVRAPTSGQSEIGFRNPRRHRHQWRQYAGLCPAGGHGPIVDQVQGPF